MKIFLFTLNIFGLLIGLIELTHGGIINHKSRLCESYCYSLDKEHSQNVMYSSKTAYQFVKSHNPNFDLPGCKPTKFWMLSRHGTRYPSERFIGEDIPAIKKIHQQFENQILDTCQLCEEDHELLKCWKWNDTITPEYGNILHTQGWDDLYLLGQSYKSIISQIVKDLKYDPNVFRFRHTDTQRTNVSFRAFFDGIFGLESNIDVILPDIPKIDTLLRPYDHCEEYDERSKDKEEAELFEKTLDFKNLVLDISTKLGFSDPLEKEKIKSIWALCRYEQSWQLTKSSPWCSLFTHNHHKILEYYEDLKYYHKAGYAYPENEMLMCEAMQDMLQNLKSTKGHKVTSYFSHSTALNVFLLGLDWRRDKIALTANNFKEQENRLWKSSQMGPFATNIAVVKYSCNNDKIDRVRFFENEIPFIPDWCDVNGICSLDDILHKYNRFLDVDCSKVFCI